jgi:hypothetical protein
VDGRPRKFYRGLVEELIAFAEHEFWLSQRMEDGATRRQHFESAARQGAPSPYLAGPPLPETLAYLWGWFRSIHEGRTPGMGDGKATHLDLMAWQANNSVRLEPWEHDAIQALGTVWLAENSSKKSAGDLPPSLRER